jgi:hypothetical protein
MAHVQKPPRKVDLENASDGDPEQTEERSAVDSTEAIDRRTIRQAIMTQMLSEIAQDIIDSKVKIDRRDKDGKVIVKGDLKTRYPKEKNTTFHLLRDLIEDPEVAFNTTRNKLFAIDKAGDRNVRLDFGSINLVVFRNAMALGDGDPKSLVKVDVEEVAKRVLIRAGRSSYYGQRSEMYDRGFAGCK